MWLVSTVLNAVVLNHCPSQTLYHWFLCHGISSIRSISAPALFQAYPRPMSLEVVEPSNLVQQATQGDSSVLTLESQFKAFKAFVKALLRHGQACVNFT